MVSLRASDFRSCIGMQLQTSSKQPDWIHVKTKERLWMKSASTPRWVRTKLAAMSQGPAETRTLDNDEVISGDHALQELVTIKSM